MMHLNWDDRSTPEEVFRVIRVTGSSGPLLPLHTHDFHETFWIESGSCEHLINGVRERLEQGAMRFISPADAHQLSALGRRAFTMVNLEWQPRAFARLIERHPEELALFTPGSATRRKPHLSSAVLERLAHFIHDRADRAPTALEMERTVLELHDAITPARRTAEDADAPDWLRAALMNLRNIETQREGLTAFFRTAGRSPEHVTRVCRQKLGKTPNQLLTEARMQSAHKLLRLTDKSIGDIAAECGYEAPSSFHRQFTRRYRCSPREYRRQL